jgi:hypothetical protein
MRDIAGKVKMEFEEYTHYKVCAISVDFLEDMVHLKWKVETNIEDLWRLKQRWPIEYYYTVKMLIAFLRNSPESLQIFVISFFERYLNFAPEDEGDNFRDLCLLSIKADRRQIRDLEKKFVAEDIINLTGARRQKAMEELQEFTREIIPVRQNYKGTLINKSSVIYKAV